VEKEMKPISKVRHQNLVLFLGVATRRADFSVMAVISEFMSEGSLYSLIHNSDQSLAWHQRIGFGIMIAEAMHYLHLSNIVHGRLSSKNVLLNEELIAKVADYGLARLHSLDKGEALHDPTWTAPEVLRNSKSISTRSDVYSFGMILYELLTRDVPFKNTDNSVVKATQQVLADTRPNIPAGCPPAMVALINSCWHKSPSARPEFDHIVEVLKKLQGASVDATVFESKTRKSRPKTQKENKKRTEVKRVDLKEHAALMIQPHEIVLEDLSIGKGSYGEVFRGTMKGTLTVAAKLVANTPEAQACFFKELKLHSSLRHENIVLFLNACMNEEHLMMIMEYCNKGDLYSLLQNKEESLSWDKIMSVLQGVASGLAYLHQTSPPILHRDLKSSNILLNVDPNGGWTAKIADFGLTEFKNAMTPDASLLGPLNNLNPRWLAPEVKHTCLRANSPSLSVR
jgi:serine/threonine protein kinase